MHLQTIVKALRLPADAKRAVDRLLEQPAVQEALERRGVEFLNHGNPGVRLK